MLKKILSLMAFSFFMIQVRVEASASLQSQMVIKDPQNGKIIAHILDWEGDYMTLALTQGSYIVDVNYITGEYVSLMSQGPYEDIYESFYFSEASCVGSLIGEKPTWSSVNKRVVFIGKESFVLSRNFKATYRDVRSELLIDTSVSEFPACNTFVPDFYTFHENDYRTNLCPDFVNSGYYTDIKECMEYEFDGMYEDDFVEFKPMSLQLPDLTSLAPLSAELP